MSTIIQLGRVSTGAGEYFECQKLVPFPSSAREGSLPAWKLSDTAVHPERLITIEVESTSLAKTANAAEIADKGNLKLMLIVR
jgi:hypothetical protein